MEPINPSTLSNNHSNQNQNNQNQAQNPINTLLEIDPNRFTNAIILHLQQLQNTNNNINL